MAARAAAGERGRDGGQATRGGLRGALERLSPRQSREPKGAPNKIRMPHETKQGRPASLAGSRSSSSAGVGAEPPGAGGGLGAAEAQERVASALCEAVRRAVREELREQARETTCALQDAVRSEVSLALRASPSSSSWRQATPLVGSPGGGARASGFRLTRAEVQEEKLTSGEVQAGPAKDEYPTPPTSPTSQFSPTRSSSKKMSKERTLSEERERHLSKFAERQGQTEAVELGTATVWIERLNGLWKLKEPRRSGRLAMLFQNSWFEVFVQVIIMVNCIFMALAANSEMTNWDEDQNPLILPLEIVFQVIYTVELVAKLYVHGWYFFWNEDWALNMLDFTLVFTGALDIVLRLGKLWNVTYMRSLRVVKVAKALRLVRVITGAVQLRNIFICIIGSLMNFIWSIVMIAVVLYMFSLGMVISAATHLQEMGEGTTDSDEKVRVELLSMYGSVQQSMLTLYKATTGGDDWSLSFNAISNTGWVASAVYLIFVSFMHIALVNIITGIFVDTALERLAPDREAMALSRRKEDEMVALELRKLWREVGEDDEFISAADFHRGLRDDRIPAWFQHVGLSLDNVIQFFGVLWRSSENGKVRINNFVHGCMRLKGSASSFDIQELRSEVSTISRKVDRLGLT